MYHSFAMTPWLIVAVVAAVRAGDPTTAAAASTGTSRP
jgi:hypothetical protein